MVFESTINRIYAKPDELVSLALLILAYYKKGRLGETQQNIANMRSELETLKAECDVLEKCIRAKVGEK